MSILTRTIQKFPYGQIDTIEDRKIPEGASSRALDWLPMGDRIELRRGSLMYGTDDGVGRVSGLHVGYKADGTQILFKTFDRKLKFFDESLTTPDWVENGSNVLPAGASGEDVSFTNYASLAGAQTFLSSPNSGLYKIMTASPGSITNLTNTAKNFAGYLISYFNRLILWYRLKDKTGIYGSYIDSATYTTVTVEATTSGSGTLSFKAGGATRTCFGVIITLTASGEVYTDDYNGLLVGSLGGTGTINYTTGDYTLSNSGVGTADYQWEDSNAGGLGDFTKSGTRTAGQGFVFRQDDGGGEALGVGLYGSSLFCMHKARTWELTITTDDTNATNLPFRDKVGIPNYRAYIPTGNGIYYVDDQNSADVQLRLLTLQQLSGLVIPTSISKRKTKEGMILGVDLTGYLFDQACMIEWGDYIALACRRSNSDVNDRVLLYNTKSGAFSWHNYFVSCFAIYNGLLVAGDSVSKNVFELFSGWDDDDSEISTNYWETELSDHAIEELKKTKKLILQGLISVDQSYDIYVAPDNSGYTKLATSISGSGSYVDRGQAISIGSNMLGTQQVGGSSNGTSAYNYEHGIRLGIGKYSRIKLKFVATGIGYLSIGSYKWFKIMPRGKKILNKYR